MSTSTLRRRTFTAVSRAMMVAGFAIPAVALAQPAARETTRAPDIPPMRHVDATLATMTVKKPGSLTFLLSDDFPPFSYRDRSGALVGTAVAVGRAICNEARITCRFVVRPWEKLRQALVHGEGDAILIGLRPTPAHFALMDFTRPYLKAFGRFAVRRAAAIGEVTGEALTGRRIAVVKNTVHASWLRLALPQAHVRLTGDMESALKLLKEGQVDAVFGDWLRLAFWVRGRAAAGCCRLLPGWISGRIFAYNHQAIAVRRGNDALRHFLDRTLDTMQGNGGLRRIILRTLPVDAGEGNAAGGAARKAGMKKTVSSTGAADVASGTTAKTGDKVRDD